MASVGCVYVVLMIVLLVSKNSCHIAVLQTEGLMQVTV